MTETFMDANEWMGLAIVLIIILRIIINRGKND
jgi:hypothetical protein